MNKIKAMGLTLLKPEFQNTQNICYIRIKKENNKTLIAVVRDAIGLLRGPGETYLFLRVGGSTNGLSRGS